MAVNKYDGRNLSLMINSVEFNAAGTSVTLQNEEADSEAVTFAELAAGTARQWFFELTAVSDYSQGSFWDMLWQNAGSTVNYVFKPYGNQTASASQPHFTGKVTINSKPPVGGDAGSIWTFDARLDCDDTPTKKTQ